jgi:threonine dehydratase
MLNLTDIKDAHTRIKPMINKTCVLRSRTLNKKLESKVFFKCENFQRAGAFKFRGVCNKLLQLNNLEKNKGVVTHSSGNHAQAVALASSLLDIKSTIVMPKNAPRVKVEATRNYGANIIFCENSVKSREDNCKELIKKYDYTLVHPYDDNQIIAGAGTAALELSNEVGILDYVFCPVGGGGLLSGTAIATKGLSLNSKIIAVEPKKADDTYQSFKHRKLYPSNYPNTIADGLRTSLSERTFKIIIEKADDIVTVSEKEIIESMKFLWSRMKIIVEPSGAVSLAGVLKNRETYQNKNIGVILSGGNIDLNGFFNKYLSKIK